jgi:hypothetical protein
MKKTIKLLSMATLVIAIGTSSCKKYDDGGNNFRLEKKLVGQSWDLSFVDNEADDAINHAMALDMKQIYFSEDNKFIVNNEILATYEISHPRIRITSIDEPTYWHIRTLYLSDTTNDTYNGEQSSIDLYISELDKDNLTFKFDVSNTNGNKKTAYYEKH